MREFPVFGVLEGVFIMGVIDEIRYNQKGELVLNELKTRKHNSMPSSAQDKVNCFQVSWSFFFYHRHDLADISSRLLHCFPSAELTFKRH